jgi:hypothetical protein
MADPYSIHDTSGGDARIHAVRRIALAAKALGKSVREVEQDAMWLTEYRTREVSSLTLHQLRFVADAYEQRVDRMMSE